MIAVMGFALPCGDLLYLLSRTKPLVLAVPVTIRSGDQMGGTFKVALFPAALLEGAVYLS